MGIHLIGDVGEGDHAKKLMDALTLSEDPIEWTRYPDEYESIWIGNDDENDPKNRLRSYNMVANRQRERKTNLSPIPKTRCRRVEQRQALPFLILGAWPMAMR